MIKLKEQILPTDLQGAKTPEELAKRLLALNTVDESLKSKTLKLLYSLLIGYYGHDFVNKALELVTVAPKTSQIDTSKKSDKSEVTHWVKVYSKKYNIDPNVVFRMLDKETKYSAPDNKYNAKVVGDKGNTLGPSYGAGQIKEPTAQEIWKKYPEDGINQASATAERLTNDIEFNIRTMCKILSHYYHISFNNLRNKKNRYAFSATAYNAGLSKTRKSTKPNSYGLYAVKT